MWGGSPRILLATRARPYPPVRVLGGRRHELDGGNDEEKDKPREREKASLASAVQADEEDMVDGGRERRAGAQGKSRPYPRPV